MTIEQDARVRILMADYAMNDAVGKLNLIGGNIAFLQLPDGVSTAPLSVVVSVEVPAKYVDQSYALAVELYDVTANSVVQVPGPDGRLQAMRIQQVATVNPLQLDPSMKRPDDAYIGNHIVMGFPTGMQLPRGHTFDWRVQINTQRRQHWETRFHVLEPVAQPVFGGPAMPSSIPGFGAFPAQEDPETPPDAAPTSEESGES
jgi:hypothetical protein